MATQASNCERMATQASNYSTLKRKFVYGMNNKRNIFSHLRMNNKRNIFFSPSFIYLHKLYAKYSNVGIMSHH